ncbi:MAG TPA: cellobiose phosphorylase [Coriobacteriia bacterium]
MSPGRDPGQVGDPRQLTAIELRNRAGLSIELLDNGSLFAIRHGDILINQVLGSPIEGGLGNVYLRRRTREGISSFPLLGPAAPSSFRASRHGAAWEGSVHGLDYSCALRLASRQPTWFWTLRLANATGRRLSLDAVLAQDLGIANEAAVRSSELYASQYIDHTILEDEDLGYLVCSRQNLPQGDAFPWIMHGCLDGAVGYLTDGFQLYGLGYKATNVPAALSHPTLPNRNYQHEFALPTLQSRRLSLRPGAIGEITFFAAFEADHPAATSEADAGRARVAGEAFRGRRRGAIARTPRPRPAGLFDAPVLFESQDLGSADLERFFGTEWRHIERRDGTLLSFFHGRQQHVVLKAKELVVERPTGHIMCSGRDLLPGDDILSVTAWMFGVFGSQLTIGNTSFNKLLSVCRNPLNVLKASGQRIFLRTGRGYELLGVPSAFEMGPNSARWIYHDDEHTLTIRVATSLDAPACRLSVDVERGGPLELLVSHDIVLGTNEHDAAGTVVVDAANARLELRPAPDGQLSQHYPETTFFIVSPDVDRIEAMGGDELLHADGADRGSSYVVVKTKPVTRFSLVLTGNILSARRAEELAIAYSHGPDPDVDMEQASADFWSRLGRRATLAGATGRCADDLARLDDVLRWYLHDAMVHYTTPHGLEQYSGAAMGLRDVCQGPTELLVATGHPGPLRDLLKLVYEHQDRETGDWPQWFMFDRFREVRAAESHADIIHWPIKSLCDYLETSGDFSILDEQVAYTDDETKAVTVETETIFAHVERQIARIERDCIPGTALPVFAGGDWEDTLQPADPEMARRMVSTWTVELAYQTLDRYREVCDRAGRSTMAGRLEGLCTAIRSDFNRYLVPDGVVAGLAHFGPDGIEYFLHPRDHKTGVAYRLLPMTRGMISGLFSVEQVRRHVGLIERHLSFPDGVRLMNRPMEYRGGTSRYFKRAESAASFGREVGLQYVHAHIRYVEAMARIGRPDEAFRGLLAVCPIRLDLDVPSALPRQANAYFSSSDAAFMDRRQASRQFGRIRTGRVGVRGGWRVYSSGPGIWINQAISNVLGLRTHFDDVVLDPVLPRRADGLTFDFEHEGRPVRYLYHVAGDGFSPREVRINGRPLPGGRYADNPYRPGGLLISKRDFGEALDRDENLVEIFI